MLNFCMRGHDFDVKSIESVAQKCAEHKLYGTQLAMNITVPDYKVGQFTPAYADRIKDIFAKNGVKLAIQSCYINPSCTDVDALESQLLRFEEQLKYARFTGAFAVATETNWVGDSCDPKANDTEHAYQYCVKNLKRLANTAEKLGVMIAVEGVRVFVINSPKRMKRMLDDINSPNVLCIFDPLNFLCKENYNSQDQMIDEVFELYGDRICAIHLKDFTDDENGFRRVPPAEGMLNIKKILTWVKHNKPDMPIVLEETKECDVDRVIKNVQALYDTIE